jgi:PmbA protein
VVVTLRVVRDGKVGTAATNRIEGNGLRELAARAGAVADSAVAEPDFPGLASPAKVPHVDSWDDDTASLGPDDQARCAAAAIQATESGVYGFFTSGATGLAVATSTGVIVSQSMTDATTMVIAAGDDCSGYSEASSWRASQLDPAAVARQAAEKAARTLGSAEVPPARYRAVLEPYALAILLEYFAWDSFSGQAMQEGRSYFSGRLGEKLFDERVSIADDPLDERGFPKAFDVEGTPKRRVPLVENGVARDVVWDRTSAARAGSGAQSTGHAPPPSLFGHGPFASSLSVAGGEAASVDELAEIVGDGIYVTRLHYLSVVDPREGVITGMTRDGTFRVRDGKIAEPLVNLRFTVSVPELLSDVPGLTRDLTLVNANDFYGERYPFGALVPALATGCFTITGTGSRPGL